MSSINNNKIISEAKPHTVKKFELIDRYVYDWMYKLLNYDKCKKLVYIDCMCNSGEYTDVNGKTEYGTPVKVVDNFCKAADAYPGKEIHIFFNDIMAEKIAHLKTLLPPDKKNMKIHYSTEDASVFLKKLGPGLQKTQDVHTLLVYDPYKAAVDWDAVMPFFNTWGEVILNHMVYDSVFNVGTEKNRKNLKPQTIQKYERTYQTDFENLIPFGTDRKAYEERIENIMASMRRGHKDFYIAAFPFFVAPTNAVVYNLIHYTTNPKGFTLFKKAAWNTFGDKSSDKNTHGMENQLTLDFDSPSRFGLTTVTDEDCYYLKDIANYLQKKFDGQENVPLDKVWAVLEEHPVFPTDGFKPKIKSELKKNHGAVVGRDTISFKSRR